MYQQWQGQNHVWTISRTVSRVFKRVTSVTTHSSQATRAINELSMNRWRGNRGNANAYKRFVSHGWGAMLLNCNSKRISSLIEKPKNHVQLYKKGRKSQWTSRRQWWVEPMWRFGPSIPHFWTSLVSSKCCVFIRLKLHSVLFVYKQFQSHSKAIDGVTTSAC